MEDFVHLHVHTYYSILDGQSSIKRLVDKAVANGMRGMAITDHGDMFGIKEFHDYVIGVNKGRKKEGLEPFIPIFGCEMYVSRYMRPRTDREDLEKYHEGLIVCSACIAGEVPHKILEGDIAGAREAIEWYHRVFGDDYYLELQRHEVKDPSLRANRETFPLQQKANKVLIELAHEYGIKLVCSNDAHFVREEMNEVFADVPEALSNTLEILDKVETYSLDHDPIMPFFPIPESFGTEEEWRKKFTEEDLFKEFTCDENGENQLPQEDGEENQEVGWL